MSNIQYKSQNWAKVSQTTPKIITIQAMYKIISMQLVKGASQNNLQKMSWSGI